MKVYLDDERTTETSVVSLTRIVRDVRSIARTHTLCALAVAFAAGGCEKRSPENDSRHMESEQRELNPLEQQLSEQYAAADGRLRRSFEDEQRREGEALEQKPGQHHLAVHQAMNRLTTGVARLRLRDATAGPQQFRQYLGQLHQLLLQVDTSACPDDFRTQYERVTAATREMRDAVSLLPDDGFEYLASLLVHGGASTNPSGAAALSVARAKYKRLNVALQALQAVARAYGVE